MKKNTDNDFAIDSLSIPESFKEPEKHCIDTIFGTIHIETVKDSPKDIIGLFGSANGQPRAIFSHLSKGVIKCECGECNFTPSIKADLGANLLDGEFDIDLLCVSCGKKLNG